MYMISAITMCYTLYIEHRTSFPLDSSGYTQSNPTALLRFGYELISDSEDECSIVL